MPMTPSMKCTKAFLQISCLRPPPPQCRLRCTRFRQVRHVLPRSYSCASCRDQFRRPADSAAIRSPSLQPKGSGCQGDVLPVRLAGQRGRGRSARPGDSSESRPPGQLLRLARTADSSERRGSGQLLRSAPHANREFRSVGVRPDRRDQTAGRPASARARRLAGTGVAENQSGWAGHLSVSGSGVANGTGRSKTA